MTLFCEAFDAFSCDAFSRHEKIALHFSGGKDSLCCLYLLREYWGRLTVVWVNTGAAFPETLEQMRRISDMVPNFLEVCGDQPAQIALKGPPSDLINAWDTPLGRLIDRSRTRKIQAPMDCCRANIWEPMHNAMLEKGFTLVIRGQRNGENKKSPIKSGYIENGIEYCFPIETWSREDVIDYLGNKIPEHYKYMDESLDCWSCTAYCDEGKVTYMKKRHPELHEKNRLTMAGIIQSASEDLEQLRRLYG